MRERSVWAFIGGVDVSCSTFFAATHRLTTLVYPHAPVVMSFDDAFRRHRLVRARSPATIADPPWLVRSPAPASLDQNAAYRNLQHDTTREHDSPLKFDPRPSRVAFCCAPFAFATWWSALRRTSHPKTAPLFRGAPLGAAASREDLAISACRIAPERRTCLVQATLLEISTRAPWFVIDVLPRKPGVVPPPARRPRPSFRHRPAKGGSFQKTKGAFHRTHAAEIAPGQPLVSEGGPAITLHPVRDALLEQTSTFFCALPCTPSPDEPSVCGCAQSARDGGL